MEDIEVWKSLEFLGFDRYEVSNFGNVKSLKRGKERLLKPKKQKNGYLSVALCNNNKQKSFLVHKLVALTFLKNPNNLPQINHKDENKENNHVDNLCWVTPKENINWGSRNKRVSEKIKGENHYLYGKHHTEETKQKMSETRKGENHYLYGKHHTEETKQKLSIAKKGKGIKPILQYTKDMVFVREFDSATSASEILNIYANSITACCKGRLKSAYGFIWRYKE